MREEALFFHVTYFLTLISPNLREADRSIEALDQQGMRSFVHKGKP